MQLVKVLYCKLLTISKQLSSFPHRVWVWTTDLIGGRWVCYHCTTMVPAIPNLTLMKAIKTGIILRNKTVSLFYLLFYIVFNSQGHITRGSLQVEEPLYTSWSSFCTVNCRGSASNYQLSNMKHPGRDSNWRPQRLRASTLTPTSPSPPQNCERNMHDFLVSQSYMTLKWESKVRWTKAPKVCVNTSLFQTLAQGCQKLPTIAQ